MVFLTLDDILESHQHQIDSYGGSHGIRDIGLLESAISQTQQVSADSICTQMFLKWQPLTSIIW